jgi:hypothetical protein
MHRWLKTGIVKKTKNRDKYTKNNNRIQISLKPPLYSGVSADAEQ